MAGIMCIHKDFWIVRACFFMDLFQVFGAADRSGYIDDVFALAR